MIRRLLPVVFSLVLPRAASAAALYLEVKDCRRPAEEGEFLQTCVKVVSGPKAGTILGPGSVAPSGQAAAVLHHRRYGSPSDRLVVKVYGTGGRLSGSYPMGSGGDEFPLQWTPPPSRYLGWVEVDGRGGLLRIVDCRRRRFALSAASPLEEWPIFAPHGARALIPKRAPTTDGSSDVVRAMEMVSLDGPPQRQTVIQTGPEEELVQIHWLSPTELGATRRKVGASKGQTVVGKWRAAKPPDLQPEPSPEE